MNGHIVLNKGEIMNSIQKISFLLLIISMMSFSVVEISAKEYKLKIGSNKENLVETNVNSLDDFKFVKKDDLWNRVTRERYIKEKEFTGEKIDFLSGEKPEKYLDLKMHEHLMKKTDSSKINNKKIKKTNLKQVIFGNTQIAVTPKPEPEVEKTNSKINLDGKLGTKSYVFKNDGVSKITASLLTYGNANLKILIKKKSGETVEWVKWSRNDDKDPSPAIVNGKKDPSSMVEVAPGDFTPRNLTLDYKASAGDEIILQLSGDFGSANPILNASFNE